MRTALRTALWLLVVLGGVAVLPRAAATAADPIVIDTADRAAVVTAYERYYASAGEIASGWTGSVGSCEPGALDADYLAAMRNVVNYFRALSGLPGAVTFDSDFSTRAQAAALMMEAAGRLSHDPPRSWQCYSEAGHEGARRSNLALGWAGREALAGFMRDPGGGNAHVGHRRWLLYPRAERMGFGDTERAAALYVIGGFGERAELPDGQPWPPDGHVPYHHVYPRWSFSYPGADYSDAAVQMRDERGAPVQLQIVSRDVTGRGDNTLVWEPAGLPDLSQATGERDVALAVEVRDVRLPDDGGGGETRDFSYTVTVIDPGRIIATPTPTVTLTPTATATPTPTATATATPTLAPAYLPRLERP